MPSAYEGKQKEQPIGCSFFLFYNFRPKGEEKQLHKLEASQSRGDADDRHTVENAEDQAYQCHFPAAQYRPNDVGDGMLAHVQLYFFPEGSEGEPRDFKELQAKGNSDDGDTKQHAANPPQQSQPKAAQQDP